MTDKEIKAYKEGEKRTMLRFKLIVYQIARPGLSKEKILEKLNELYSDLNEACSAIDGKKLIED